MKRLVLAFAAALTISACSPGGAVDTKDPLTALQPWNHNRAGIEKLPNGVEYYVVRKGDGKEAAPGEKDMVEVKYEGRLAENGLVFDSSYQRGDTAKFRLNQVIPGWTTGMQKMQPGDMFVFWIPSKEGYGASGQGMQIPPNADLMFQVELLKVIADPWAKAMPWPSKVTTASAGLTGHLLRAGKDGGKADFFGPAPTDAKFVSTSVVANGITAKINGNLTLNGVTKPVVLDTKFSGAGNNPFNRKATVGFHATSVIKRSEFGIGYAVPMISDDVTLDISVAFEKAS